MAKNKKKRLRGKADKLWYEKLIKKNPKCKVCGKRATQVHHFWYKSNYGHIRYDLDNGISLCQGCHFVVHHQDPKKIEEKIVEARGIKWYNKLKKKAYNPPMGSYQTVKWYEDNINKLK